MHDAYEPYVKALAPIKVTILAIAGGLVAFIAVAVGLVTRGTLSFDPAVGRLLLVALGLLSVGELLAWMVLRRVLMTQLHSRFKAATQDHRQEILVKALPTRWIVPAAMAEGFGLFGVVVLMVGGRWLALVAPAVALCVLGALWPSRERVGAFVDSIDSGTKPGNL